jgi:hypothetical protein
MIPRRKPAHAGGIALNQIQQIRRQQRGESPFFDALEERAQNFDPGSKGRAVG